MYVRWSIPIGLLWLTLFFVPLCRLNSCYGGFGSNGKCWYKPYLEEGEYDKSLLGVPFSKGHLTQSFSNIENSNDLIDELSTLMTR